MSFYQKFWSKIFSILLFLRDHRILLYPVRQRYRLGFLIEGKSATEFKNFLVSQGFEERFVAWVDPGETLSLRKIDQIKYQYHLRLYRDGEVRGHYELTPESDPIGHLFEKYLVPNRAKFLEMLRGWIPYEGEPETRISQSAPAAFRGEPFKG